MADYNTGLDLDSFRVTADFAVDDVAPGENLAGRFRPVAQGVWEMTLAKGITALSKGKLMVVVKDRQGNVSRIERTFSAGTPASGR
jgi:hypothetical protein